jgi:Ser/Thr protein kinase RdoA (MazF antagonist)
VHGVDLDDGRAVVVKAHRPAVTLAFLEAIGRVQRALADHGVPAPQPLTEPVPYGSAHLTAETLLAGDAHADGHDPVVRRAIAEGLAGFVRTGRALGLERALAMPHPMAVPAGALYPEPHSLRFDFDATAAGCEWIDDLARRARNMLAAVPAGPELLVHGDWRIENVAVEDGAVVAIYDWDSVCVQPEVATVATSVWSYCVDWTRPVGEHFPSNDEMRGFLADHEAARGAPFDARERTFLAARIVHALAYGARCERAVAWPEVADSQQALLRRLGGPLLRHGLAALDA